jgi:hypothetical protein
VLFNISSHAVVHIVHVPVSYWNPCLDTVEVGSLHTLRLESLKLVFQPLHTFIVNKL